MPGYDRTGPRGEGPMTGRGAGYCGPAGRGGYEPRGAGRGFAPYGGGRGRAFGGGRGFRFGPNAPWPHAASQQDDPSSSLERVTQALSDVMESAKEVLGLTKEMVEDYRKARETPKG